MHPALHPHGLGQLFERHSRERRSRGDASCGDAGNYAIYAAGGGNFTQSGCLLHVIAKSPPGPYARLISFICNNPWRSASAYFRWGWRIDSETEYPSVGEKTQMGGGAVESQYGIISV